MIEALPPKSEQFAWTKCIGHIQLQQDAILRSQFNKCEAELIPGKGRGVRIPSSEGTLTLGAGSFTRKS